MGALAQIHAVVAEFLAVKTDFAFVGYGNAGEAAKEGWFCRRRLGLTG
jgi:hypothetical protein